MARDRYPLVSRSMHRRRLTRILGTAGICGLSSMTACLDRPLAPSSPKTSNAVTAEVKQSRVEKIDLLFMIDNSSSMGDKQQILSVAVPDLVRRLVDPTCFDDDGKKGTKINGQCPPGFAPEFEPILDIHIGVVTSSLGGHGSDECAAPTATAPTPDDHGELVARGKDAASTPTNFYKNSGFFAWDAATPPAYPGENTFHDIDALGAQFKLDLAGAGEGGCGYEASLEAWYRFLVDPVPPRDVPLVPDPSDHSDGAILKRASPLGVNDKVLSQRETFLRPDSLVAVIVLSDENDCSLADGPIPENNSFPNQMVERAEPNYPASQDDGFLMRPGTTACEGDPWSDDCQSCWYFNGSTDPHDSKAAGCFDENADFVYLTRGNVSTHTIGQDPINLRCWDQKRRYGVDAMYPLTRYVNGLTEPLIDGRRVEANGDTPQKEGKPVADQSRYFNPLRVTGWRKANDEKRKLDQALASGETTQVEFDAAFQKLQDTYLGKDMSDPEKVRPGSLIFFATIVGVPWQDIARDPTNLEAGFRPVDQFTKNLSALPRENDIERALPGKDFSTWDLILGNTLGFGLDEKGHRKPRAEPRDPLMVERRNPINNEPHPITGEVIGGSDTWNSINGQEWHPQTDLQYACILPLPDGGEHCSADVRCNDCGDAKPEDLASLANPLCNVDGAKNSTYDNTRRRAKAYPGTRFLEVLRQFNDKVEGNAIGASICASNVTEPVDQNGVDRADYGYRPAVAAILDRLKILLHGPCFPRALSVTNHGTLDKPLNSAACLIIGASDKKDATHTEPTKPCNCDGKGEAKIPADVDDLLSSEVKEDFFCRCELQQFEGTDLRTCQTSASTHLVGANGEALSGWCYVDPGQVPSGSDAFKAASKIVSVCPDNAKHTVRFINLDTEGTTFFVTCLGAAAGTE